KREFGKKLIEEVLPRLDLTHVIDCSRAHIPRHGTPTAILLGRHPAPLGAEVRAVMGIRGEPATPADPRHGLVWCAILAQTDVLGSTSEFVSVAAVSRATLKRHPWSIGGGGAAELKEKIEAASQQVMADKVETIGFFAITGEDGAYILPQNSYQFSDLPAAIFGLGDEI